MSNVLTAWRCPSCRSVVASPVERSSPLGRNHVNLSPPCMWKKCSHSTHGGSSLVWELNMPHVPDVVVVPTRTSLCHPEDDWSVIVFLVFKQCPNTNIFLVTKTNVAVDISPHNTWSLQPPANSPPKSKLDFWCRSSKSFLIFGTVVFP